MTTNATDVAPRPALRLTVQDPQGRRTTLSIDKTLDRAVLGRHGDGEAQADIAIDDPQLANHHCFFLFSWEEGWLIGGWPDQAETMLDGVVLGAAPAPLSDGSIILVGGTILTVALARVDGDEAATVPLPDSPSASAGAAAEKPLWDGARLSLDDDADQSPPVAAAVVSDDGEADRRDHDRRPFPEVVLTGFARELVDRGLLDGGRAATLMNTAREKGKTFFRALIDDQQVKSRKEIMDFIGEILGLPVIADEKTLMDQAVATPWLPYAKADGRGVVMLESAGGAPVCAVVDPFDLAQDDWVTRCLGGKAGKMLVLPDVFSGALQRLKNQTTESDGAANVLVIDISVEEEQRLIEALERADTPRIVNLTFQRAHNRRASDIHIEPTEEYLLVRNRIDGILHEEISLPATMHAEISSRIKIISGMDVAEKRRPQDGRIALVVHGNPVDVRVSTYPTIYGEKVVMRLLDKNALRPRPDDLGMLKDDLKKLYEKLNAPFGLVMISGPTGSGKTTTLYSCLGSIDKKAKNVLTVEDPVEYRLKGVHQMQVNERIGLTFASGLRTILRQDPDVIMVGECRDSETASMSVQASLTGHIVFSTIHTNDAIGVVTRMLDMGIDHFRVANALTLAIAQRLVRKVCVHCATRRKGINIRRALADEGVSDERLEKLGVQIDDRDFYIVGVGCEHCRNTGYLGRQPVFEVFEMTNRARNLIMSPGFNAEELRALAREEGMKTLIEHGLWMIDQEKTTHAEIIRVLGETY